MFLWFTDQMQLVIKDTCVGPNCTSRKIRSKASVSEKTPIHIMPTAMFIFCMGYYPGMTFLFVFLYDITRAVCILKLL